MIYLIPGLGADERCFQYLKIKGETNYLQWIQPSPNEGIAEYSRRMLAQIDLTKPVTLIGYSFGGIIAQEIAQLIKVEKTIIVASVKNRREMPFYFSLLRKLPAHKLLPSKMMMKAGRFTAPYFFGTRNKNESQLVKKIIKDTDRNFFKWAVASLINWNSKEIKNIYHLHGTKDRILPSKKIRGSMELVGGGHFMMVSEANELTLLINKVLQY
jgi:pimeloyl-ACP methyl ester carboxylesterase